MSKDSPPPLHHKNADRAHGIVKSNSHDASRAEPSRVKTYYPPRDLSTAPEARTTPERPEISPITSPGPLNPPSTGINRQGTAGNHKVDANRAPIPDDDDVIEVEVRKPGTYDNEVESESESSPSPKHRKVKKTRNNRRQTLPQTGKRKAADRGGTGTDSEDSDAPIARKRRRTTLPAFNPLPPPGDVDEGEPELGYFGETDSEFEREDRDSYQVNIRISVLTDPAATHAIIEEKVDVTDADTMDKCQSIIARLRNDDMDLYFSKDAEIVAYRVVGFDNLDDTDRTVYDASWVNITRTTERQFADWAETVKFVDNAMGTLTAQFLVIDTQSAAAETAGGDLDSEEADVDDMDELEDEGQDSPGPESSVGELQAKDRLTEEAPIPVSPMQSLEQSPTDPDVPIIIENEVMEDEQSPYAISDVQSDVEERGEGHNQSSPVSQNLPASPDNGEVTDDDHLIVATFTDLAQFFEHEETDHDQAPAAVPGALAKTASEQGEDKEPSQSPQSLPSPIQPSSVLPNGQIKPKEGPSQRIGRRKPSGEPGDWMGRSTSAETTVPVTQMNMGEYDLWKAKEADYEACYERNVSIETENVQLRMKVEVLEHQLAMERGGIDTPVLVDEDIDDAFDKLSLEREVRTLRRENAELKRWRQGRLTIDLEKGSVLLKALAATSDALNAVGNDMELGDSGDEDERNDGSAGASTSKGKEVAPGSRSGATATGSATTSAGNDDRIITLVTSEGFRTAVRDSAGRFQYEESNLRTTGGREEGELSPVRF